MTEQPYPEIDLGARFTRLAHDLLAGAARPLEYEGQLTGAEFVRSLTAALAQDGDRYLELQQRYYRDQLELWGELLETPNEARQ